MFHSNVYERGTKVDGTTAWNRFIPKAVNMEEDGFHPKRLTYVSFREYMIKNNLKVRKLLTTCCCYEGFWMKAKCPRCHRTFLMERGNVLEQDMEIQRTCALMWLNRRKFLVGRCDLARNSCWRKVTGSNATELHEGSTPLIETGSGIFPDASSSSCLRSQGRA